MKGRKKVVEVDGDLLETPKIRTTIFLDVDLKERLKKEASKKGLKYQQLIREVLFDYLNERGSLERRVSKLEKLIKEK